MPRALALISTSPLFEMEHDRPSRSTKWPALMGSACAPPTFGRDVGHVELVVRHRPRQRPRDHVQRIFGVGEGLFGFGELLAELVDHLEGVLLDLQELLDFRSRRGLGLQAIGLAVRREPAPRILAPVGPVWESSYIRQPASAPSTSARPPSWNFGQAADTTLLPLEGEARAPAWASGGETRRGG